MSRKAKEILLARGYTEAELAGMDTLLKDQKFCAAIEAEAASADEATALATERQSLLTQNETWYNDYATPELAKARQDAIDARAKQAEAEARLKAQQDYGLAKVAEKAGHEPDTTVSNPRVDNTPPIDVAKFVTVDAFDKTARSVGDSMIMLTDILEDHRELFGKRLPGGMSKLRENWQKSVADEHYRGSLRDYWEKEYKVQARRDELVAKEKADHEKSIRDDQRTKDLSEFGNPNTRPLALSHNPFTNKTIKTDESGKPVIGAAQPWEKSKEQRATERLSKFTNKQLQGSVQ